MPITMDGKIPFLHTRCQSFLFAVQLFVLTASLSASVVGSVGKVYRDCGPSRRPYIRQVGMQRMDISHDVVIAFIRGPCFLFPWTCRQLDRRSWG